MPPSRVITQVRRIPEQNSPIQPTFRLDESYPSSLQNSLNPQNPQNSQKLIFQSHSTNSQLYPTSKLAQFSHKATILVVFIVIWYAIYIVFAVFTGFRKFHRSIFRRAAPGPIYFMKDDDSFKDKFKDAGKHRLFGSKITRVGSGLDTIPENMYPSFGNI